MTVYCPTDAGRPCERGCGELCLAAQERVLVEGGSRTVESTVVDRVGRWTPEQLAEAHRRLAEPAAGYPSGYAYARARYGLSTRREAAELFLELSGVLEQPQGLSVPGRVRDERPGGAQPGAALDGQGLPPAADTSGGTA